MSRPGRARVGVFSNGTEAEVWVSHNCDICWKAPHRKPDGSETRSYCAIERALLVAQTLDRADLPAHLAARLGWTNQDQRRPDCPERASYRPAQRPRQRRDTDLGPIFTNSGEGQPEP